MPSHEISTLTHAPHLPPLQCFGFAELSPLKRMIPGLGGQHADDGQDTAAPVEPSSSHFQALTSSHRPKMRVNNPLKKWLATGAMSALWACSPLAFAEIYKCAEKGKIVYQEAPCAGSELQGDAPWDRERRQNEEYKKRAAAKATAEMTEFNERKTLVRSCLTKESACAAQSFAYMVHGFAKFDLKDALGDPDNIQRFGGEEVHYYKVWLIDGDYVKLRRVQITFGYNGNHISGRSMQIVDKVNIY